MATFDLHASKKFEDFASGLIRDLRTRGSVLLPEKGELLLPTSPGIYMIAVSPGDRYGALLKGIDTWFGEQRAFYLGEAVNLCERLKTHRDSAQHLVEVAEKAAAGGAPDITWDSFAFSFLELAEPPEPTRIGGPRRSDADMSLPERLAMESSLVVALRPVANGLGFGTRGHNSDEIWQLLQPDSEKGYEGPLTRLNEGHAPWLDWEVAQELGRKDPGGDEDADGEAYYPKDDELRELTNAAGHPRPTQDLTSPHQLSRDGQRLRGGRKPRAPGAE